MSDRISFEEFTSTKRFDKEGNILKGYNKKTKGIVNIRDIDKNKIGIDAQMMTSAILNSDFKKTLIENIGEDFPYTTELCKKETTGNIKFKKKIAWEEAKGKFEEFEKEISLKYLNFKPEYQREGEKLFTKIIASGIKIENKRTFLNDCINIITILKNNVGVFFCNDEELAKACKKFKIKIEFIKIPTSNEKVIKDFWKPFPKLKYQKRGQKAKR